MESSVHNTNQTDQVQLVLLNLLCLNAKDAITFCLSLLTDGHFSVFDMNLIGGWINAETMKKVYQLYLK
jgi:hypothetical protein